MKNGMTPLAVKIFGEHSALGWVGIIALLITTIIVLFKATIWYVCVQSGLSVEDFYSRFIPLAIAILKPLMLVFLAMILISLIACLICFRMSEKEGE